MILEWVKRLKWWYVKSMSGIGNDIQKTGFYFGDDILNIGFYFGDVVILTHHQKTGIWQTRLWDSRGVPGTSIVTTLERLFLDFGDDIGIKILVMIPQS